MTSIISSCNFSLTKKNGLYEKVIIMIRSKFLVISHLIARSHISSSYQKKKVKNNENEKQNKKSIVVT